MTAIYVKPAPGLDPAAAKVLKSDTGVGLLDSAGAVPEAGMPWPNGGLTLALLRDGAILRADDPVFAALKAEADAEAAEAKAKSVGEAAKKANAGGPSPADPQQAEPPPEPVASEAPVAAPEAPAK